MKIYTKRGDNGITDLPGGRRLWKNDVHIEALGDLDELVSIMGVVRALLPEGQTNLDEELRSVQVALVNISAALSGPRKNDCYDSTTSLETAIDSMEEGLPPLKSFILPGAQISASVTHVARAVCRRAERRLVALLEAKSETGEKVDEQPLAYLNRLSDYLFSLARHLNKLAGVADDDISL